MKKILYILTAMLLLVSCETEEIRYDGGRVPMRFTAAMAQQDEKPASRSYLSGSDILWQTGDRICIFDGSANNCFTLADGADNAYATFAGAAAETSEYFALYPYQSGASLTDGVISATIPVTQTAVAGTYDPAAFISAAVTGDNRNFIFRNACSLLKFTADADYSSVVIRGNGGEMIAGDVLITASASEPYISLSNGAAPSASVTLSGTITEGESYLAAIRPQNLESGLEVVLTDADGQVFRQTWSAKNMGRNKAYNLGTLSPTQIFLDALFSADTTKVKVDSVLTFNLWAKSFTANNLHDITIEYSDDNGSSWHTADTKMSVDAFAPAFTADAAGEYTGTVDVTFSEINPYKVRMTAYAGGKSVSKSVDINVVSPIVSTYYLQDGSVVANPVEGVNTGFSVTWHSGVPDFKIAYCDENGNAIDWEAGDVLEAKITSSDQYTFSFGDATHTSADGLVAGYSNGNDWWRIELRRNSTYSAVVPNVFSHFPHYIRISKEGGLEYSTDGISYTTAPEGSDYLQRILLRGRSVPFYFGCYYTGHQSKPVYEYLKVTRGGSSSTPVVSVESVTVSPANAALTVLGTTNLSAAVNPSGVSQLVDWSSSNTSVATVNSSGVVTAVAPGNCDIIATSLADGTKQGTCAVTVTYAAPTGVTVSPASTSVAVGKNTVLSATVSPAGANQAVTWSSSNTSIATVNASTGRVTGVAEGSCSIIATSVADGSKTATCALTVTPAPVGPAEVILWEDYTSSTPFSTVLDVVTSGTPDDDEIDFSHGDYIEIKYTLPAGTTEGMTFHVGQASSNPWDGLKAVYAYINVYSWTTLYYRATNKQGSGANYGMGPIYIRFGKDGSCSMSSNGTTWLNNADLDALWADNVTTLSSITVGDSMTGGSGYLTRLTGVYYEYVKIVRGE